ncbi:MAG: hypothetical protein KY462_01855 [Actinobacteria bacterium]|nr:hypothetical protein [Actinomycetota bacterium]
MSVRRALVVLTILAVGAAGGVAAWARHARHAPDGQHPVRVGTGPEREASLLAHVLVALLEADDVAADVVEFADARDARQAVELGDVEVVPSYTGAVWMDALGLVDPPRDPAASYERVSRADARRHPLEWLAPTGVNATLAFVVQRPPAREWMDDLEDLATVLASTDDAARDEDLPRLCVHAEFASRSDGLAEVVRVYVIRTDRTLDEFVRTQVLAVPPEDAVRGVERGECVAGLTTRTDGNAWVRGLKPLDDPRGVFPAFVVAPVIHEGLRRTHPQAVAALDPFRELNEELLRRWNGRLVLDEPVEAVAAEAAATLRERSRRPRT